MRTMFLAAAAALTVGALSAEPAQADWRDAILGNRVYVQQAPAPKSAAKGTSQQKKTYAGQPKSTQSKSSSSSGSSYSSGGSVLTGQASYYWQPQRVASGGWFNPNAMTAAHKSLPFGTKVRVTNQRNGQSVVVTINDRGPYIAGRIIDLSSAAAGAINMKNAGVVPVSVTVLGK